MGNPDHVARLRQGVVEWNAWRAANPLHSVSCRPDLSNEDLSELKLQGANLSQANLVRTRLLAANLRGASFDSTYLSNADLTGADLSDAKLRDAYLNGTCLRAAICQEADLTSTNVSEANFRGANLRGARFDDAILVGADLTGAAVDGTNFTKATLMNTGFVNLDLSNSIGLKSCIHRGPSSVGIDTLYRSHGQIPVPFLRGCGVPEAMVTYANSLTIFPFEFYSCFISYSGKDQEFAEKLCVDLQKRGVRCWYAPNDITGGKKIHEQIESAIQVHDRLLLILSEHSMSSEWVETEIAKARKRELKEKRKMLFPVRLVEFQFLKNWECFDADTGKDSAREIREYFIPDFSNWKDNDSYKLAFDRLIRDLTA